LSDKRARQIAARAALDNMLSFGECAGLYKVMFNNCCSSVRFFYVVERKLPDRSR